MILETFSSVKVAFNAIESAILMLCSVNVPFLFLHLCLASFLVSCPCVVRACLWDKGQEHMDKGQANDLQVLRSTSLSAVSVGLPYVEMFFNV